MLITVLKGHTENHAMAAEQNEKNLNELNTIIALIRDDVWHGACKAAWLDVWLGREVSLHGVLSAPQGGMLSCVI